MVKEEKSRTASLIGEERLALFAQKSVIVFGVGGVGAYAAEALARAGVGGMTLVDHDTVSLSNINRQLIALHSTVGRPKVEVMGERICDIDPDIRLTLCPVFASEENLSSFAVEQYDFVLDCIDTVSAKIALICEAKEKNIPVISAMGAGNKLDMQAFTVTDISKTAYCPLAKAVRTGLRKKGIEHLPVVWSPEQPICRPGTPASIAYVPATAGLLMASYVLRSWMGEDT